MVPKTIRFPLDKVCAHVALNLPNRPEMHRDEIVEQVVGREWVGVTLVGAVGIVATNTIRHGLTEYEVLYRSHTVSRDEARGTQQIHRPKRVLLTCPALSRHYCVCHYFYDGPMDITFFWSGTTSP